MKNFVRTTIFNLFLLTLILACTKEIDLKTEVEFSVTEQHKAEGYIKEELPTTVTVVPEEILEDFSYSYSYSVLKGEGHFHDDAGEQFPQDENIPLNPFSANVMYVGSKSGEHVVKVIATDNYGFTEEVEIDYAISEIPPVTWTVTSPVQRIELGNNATITVHFEKSEVNAETEYQRSYSFTAGSGTLIEPSERAAITLDKYESIEPGTYTLDFTPDELGTMELVFELKGDNGEAYVESLSFEVLEEIIDTVSPVITLLGENPLIIERGGDYDEPGAKATDDVDGDISDAIAIDSSDVDTSFVGTYLITYNVIDSSGNTSVEVIRTVEVVPGDKVQSSENDILAFALPGQEQTSEIDLSAHTITIDVPFGTDTNVAPIALTISINAEVYPTQNQEQSFENPVIYVVSAENGSEQEWTVTVNVAASTNKSIESFSIDGVSGVISGDDILVTLPSGNDEKSLSPSIAHTGVSISPSSGTQLDFTNAVTYTVTAEDGTQKTFKVKVQIENDRPVAIASASPLEARIGENVDFTGSLSTDDILISGYSWNFGNVNIGEDADTAYSFDTHGKHQITLTVTDDGGLTNSTTLVVEVPNRAPNAVASADRLSVNINESIRFTGSNSNDDLMVTGYDWNFGDLQSSSVANPTHSYSNSGTYQVVLTVTDGAGATNTATLEITVVNQPPSAILEKNQVSAYHESNVIFKGSDSTDDIGVTSYYWEFGDGSTSSLADPDHFYDSPGNYSVRLTVSDGEFSDTASTTVTIYALNTTTGKYTAPAGSRITVTLSVPSYSKGSASIEVHTGANKTGTSLMRTSLGWDRTNGQSTSTPPETKSFSMPSNGVVYFYGRHQSEIQIGSNINITSDDGTAYEADPSLSNTMKIQD